MIKIYSSDSLKRAESNYNSIKLMELAARNIVSVVLTYAKEKPITILCGSGNNGGDGWAAASLLKNNDVTVIYLKEPNTKECKYYHDIYTGKSLSIESGKAFEIIEKSEFILDCILGIGLKCPANDTYQKVFEAVNNSNAFVLSVDVPSGIPSDYVKNYPHIKADATISITCPKLSELIAPLKYDFGKIHSSSLGIDMSHEKPLALCTNKSVFYFLSMRPPYSNKGTFGTLKTLCGSFDMPGAGILAINASLRMGVGLVKVFGNENLLNIYKSRLTEPIFKSFNKETFLQEKATAALIGCGIGNEYDSFLKEIIININCPLVIDADGINFISRNADIQNHIPNNTVLTPHSKEMARLLGTSTEEIENNRFEISEALSKKLGCTIVLKGNSTIIASPGKTTVINSIDNSGLAKGGSGDVLAGIIASLLAQGMDSYTASVLGVFLHGEAADSLRKKYSEFAFLPSDIPLEIGKIIAENIINF